MRGPCWFALKWDARTFVVFPTICWRRLSRPIRRDGLIPRGLTLLASLLRCSFALNLPAGEAHVVFSIELVAPDIEVDRHRLADLVAIENGALVLHDLELEILRELVVLGGDDEFPLGETAGERLSVEDDFDFSGDFKHSGILDESDFDPWVFTVDREGRKGG